jgi:CHAT domain-containing protein
MSTLLAGLSRPGPAVVKDLPFPQLQRLVYSVIRQTQTRPSGVPTRGSDGIDAKDLQADTPIAALSPQRIQELLNDPLILEKSQQALSLPGVEKEIGTLAKLLPSSALVDEHFVGQRLHEEILKAQYRVVHIASHGYFGHSSDKSFVMTYDQVLTMDELETLLLSDKFGESPVELLTLSACQTAEGDDRSPLGLSGMALKTNVRSVLGSLWPVSDEATVQLMQAFYRRLNAMDVSKAQALQQAQIELLRDGKRSHPFYWSPFILVGNWL